MTGICDAPRAATAVLLSLVLGPMACAEDLGGDDPTAGGASWTTAASGEAATTTSTGGSTSGPASTDDTSDAAPGSTTGGSSGSHDDDTANTSPIIFDVLRVADVPDDAGGVDGPPTDIDVVITADNAYAFGYGTAEAMSNYFGGIENTLAAQIFSCSGGPEQYTVPAQDATGAAYLYIVSWADNAVTQGVIGQFRRVSGEDGGGFGAVVYTGDPGWEVCATGLDYSPGGGGPDLAVVNEQIALCNEGNTDPLTTSQGWVDESGTDLGALAVGEPNDTPYDGGPQPGNEFKLVCQSLIDEAASWMWFNWDPQNIVWPAQTPFMYPGGTDNPMHDFMIFRLAADHIPPPPPQ